MRSWVMGMLGLVLGAALAAPAIAAGEAGAVVGRLHRQYVDETRTDWAGTAPRPLAVTVWYPAAEGSQAGPWSVGIFQFGTSALNAPLAEGGNWPLIVLSHGTGGSAAQLSWLAEQLVQAGFVVAGINHHGNTGAEDQPWPQGFVLPGERARDLGAVIDKVLVEPQLAGRIDAGRIGAAGFSIGGYSVLAAAGAWQTVDERLQRCDAQPANPVCQLPPEAGFSREEVEALMHTEHTFQAGLKRDAQPFHEPRIRAVYSIAPAFVSLMTPENLAGLAVPVRFVLAGKDTQILPAGTNKAIREALPQASVQLLDDAGHYTFLARCHVRGRVLAPALCKDPGRRDRREVHAQVARDALAFFRAHL